MRIVFLIMSLFLLSPVLADTDNFQNDLNYANQHRGDVQNQAKQFKPEQNFKHFTTNPKQTKYYNGVTQGGDNNLSADAALNVNKDTAGSTVDNAFNTRPVYHVNHKSHAMLMGALIERDAANISRGISDKYVNCKRKQDCHVVYQKETCNEPVGPSDATCLKNLDVSIKEPKIDNCVHIVVAPNPPVFTLKKIGSWSRSNNRANWVWLVNGPDNKNQCVVGYVYAKGLETKRTGVAFTVPKYFPGELYVTRSNDFCLRYGTENNATLTTNTGQVVVSGSKNTAVLKGDIKTDRHIQLTIKNHHWSRACNLASYGVVTIPQTIDPITTDTWVDHCQFLEQRTNLGICAKEKETCSSGKATHFINGESITRDCWQKTAEYNCQIAPSDNNCQYLRDKACTQIDSSCRTKIGNICVVNNETYNCPNKKCSDASGIVCGGDFFCTKGDCLKHDAVENGDFNKAVAGMAAVGAAGADVKKSNVELNRFAITNTVYSKIIRNN